MADKKTWEDSMMKIERTLKISDLELRYIIQHYFDDRPKGLGEAKLTLDVETRKAIGGYFSVIEALNIIRSDANLEFILK